MPILSSIKLSNTTKSSLPFMKILNFKLQLLTFHFALLTCVFAFTNKAQAFTTDATSLPEPLQNHASVTVDLPGPNERVYVIGGFNQQKQLTNKTRQAARSTQ